MNANMNKKICAWVLSASVIASVTCTPARAAQAPQDKTYEQLKVLVDVLSYIQENYVEEPDTQKLIYGAASGMVRTLDPFSQFMDPEAHDEIKTETEGEFGGLGIRIAVKDDWMTVMTPLPGTPAYRAGILPNDRLVEINGASTKDMTLGDALKLLRGAPGTKIRLTLMRGPEDEGEGPWASREFTLTRETVKIESVQSWMLNPTVGYLRILEFSARTSQDTLSGLNDLKKQGMQSHRAARERSKESSALSIEWWDPLESTCRHASLSIL